MNFRQRAYDSYDRSNFNLKITNSYYHFKNIQKILYRKPEYKSIKKFQSPRIKMNSQPFNNYFVLRQNQLYKKIISDIRSTKVKPKINDYYQTKEEKLKDYRKQNRTLQKMELSRQNSNYRTRLRSQKSMLKIREMDKKYKENHMKMVERSRKIKDTKHLILPPITTILNRNKSPRNVRKSNYEYNISYGGSNVSKDGESLHQERYQPHYFTKIQSTE